MGFKGFRGFLCTSLPSRGPSVFCYRTSEITDLVPSDQFFDFSFLIYSSFRKKTSRRAKKIFPHLLLPLTALALSARRPTRGWIILMSEKKLLPDDPSPRGPKSLNFPDGKIQLAKTFRRKCVNRSRDKIVRISFFATKKYINCNFISYSKGYVLFL